MKYIAANTPTLSICLPVLGETNILPNRQILRQTKRLPVGKLANLTNAYPST